MKQKLSWFDRIMAAVTFAEANEHKAGKEFLSGTESKLAREAKSKELHIVLAPDLQGAEAQS